MNRCVPIPKVSLETFLLGPERTSRQAAPSEQAAKQPRGVFPIMAYTGGSARKGYLFQASVIRKGRDFTRWSIWKGREICHLDLWKGSLRGRRKKGEGEGGGRNQRAEQMNFMASYSRENILFLWLSPI